MEGKTTVDVRFSREFCVGEHPGEHPDDGRNEKRAAARREGESEYSSQKQNCTEHVPIRAN